MIHPTFILRVLIPRLDWLRITSDLWKIIVAMMLDPLLPSSKSADSQYVALRPPYLSSCFDFPILSTPFSKQTNRICSNKCYECYTVIKILFLRMARKSTSQIQTDRKEWSFILFSCKNDMDGWKSPVVIDFAKALFRALRDLPSINQTLVVSNSSRAKWWFHDGLRPMATYLYHISLANITSRLVPLPTKENKASEHNCRPLLGPCLSMNRIRR